jgi:crotonobetainyl-CoA:carnitine CoA-transferase CaiB-like acyl-CoA transferase
MEIAQSDAAAYMDWYRSESWRAYERPESEVTGNASDNYERRPPGTAGMREGVRYQMYETIDGHVLFMASEREFWENFCRGVDRMDLFEKWPGEKYADHARNNRELQAELREIFKTKTSAEWIAWSNEVNTPIAPVNTPKTIADDPQFQARLPWISQDRLGADQLPIPLKLLDAELEEPTKAPTVGEHTDDVLRRVLSYDDTKLTALKDAGALG